jgi:hypothetical protein
MDVISLYTDGFLLICKYTFITFAAHLATSCSAFENHLSRLHNTEWMEDKYVGQDLEQNSHGLCEVLSWDLPGGTDENHEKPQSGQLVSWQDSN